MKKTVLVKLIVLALMVVCVLSFAACSGNDSGSGSGDKTDIVQTITTTTATQPQDPSVDVTPPSMELEFALNEDNNSYYVKSFGVSSASEINIPDTYEGKPVTAIGAGAFRDCKHLITVIIPDSIKTIGEYAFYGCTALTEITIGENVFDIGNYAFYGCINITVINYNAKWVYEFQENNNVFTNAGIDGDGITLNIGVNVVSIPKNSFNPTGSVETAPNIKEINFEDGSNCEVIGENAFYFCVNIKILAIPDSVQTIDPLAFYGCEGLQELTIGEGITWIGEGAFSQCVNIAVINFNAIMIDEYGFGEGEKHPFTNIARDSDGVIVNIGVNVTAIPNNFFFTGDLDNPINVKEVNFADGSKCKSIGQNAFFFCKNIKVFVIPDSVTTIGEYAFHCCYALEELIMGEGVVSIGTSAFSECYNLKSLTIGENVKSIGDYAFSSCINITVINFNAILMNDLDENNNVFNDVGEEGNGITVNIGANVKVIPNNLFNPSDLASNTPAIKEVNFADGSQCEKIGYKAFYRCINIVVIKIPAGIVSIGENAFNGCTNLKTIYYDAVNITNIPESTFKHAGKNGVTVIININVKVLPESFFYNEKGENIFVDVKWNDGTKCEHPHVWSDWKTIKESNCTTTGLEERVCKCGEKQTKILSLKEHIEVIDKAVSPTCTATGLSEGKHCLECNTVIVAQRVIPANGHTEVIDKALSPTCTETGLSEGKHCSVCNTILIAQTVSPANGHTVVIDEAVAPTCTETGLSEGKHCSTCNTVLVAQIVVSAKGHTEVVDKAVEPTCTDMGLTEGKHCSNCSAIIVVQMTISAKGHGFGEWVIVKQPSTTEEGLKERYCKCGEKESKIISIILPASEGLEFTLNDDGQSYSVTGIGNCKDTKIVIPNIYDGLPVTSIGEKAFYEHSSFTSVTIPDSVTSIGDKAFSKCSSLKSLTIGDSVASIGKAAFYYCTSLTSVIIPDSVTSVGSQAFQGCRLLANISFGDSVTSIGSFAFKDCHSLTSVTIGCSVTSIGGDAFYNCDNLRSIIIPSSVTSIGSSVFYDCRSLTSIKFEGTVEQWNAILKQSTWHQYVPAMGIICTDGTVSLQ